MVSSRTLPRPLSCRALIASLVAAAVIGGCAARRPPSPPRAAVPPSEVSAEALLAKLDARSKAIHSFRALAEMRYVGEREKLAVREVVVVERPDRLRIEMMSAFGVALQIASDGERVCAYHRGDQTFYHGRATIENLARFTRLELAVHDIADLLIGIPPRRERTGRPTLSFERPQGLWRVSTQLAGGDTQTLWFEPEGLLPVRASEVDSAGNTKYLATYADYTTVSNVDVPDRIRFDLPGQGAQVELRYSERTLNGESDPGLFCFDPPAGSKVVDLDALPAGPPLG